MVCANDIQGRMHRYSRPDAWCMAATHVGSMQYRFLQEQDIVSLSTGMRPLRVAGHGPKRFLELGTRARRRNELSSLSICRQLAVNHIFAFRRENRVRCLLHFRHTDYHVCWRRVKMWRRGEVAEAMPGLPSNCLLCTPKGLSSYLRERSATT